ncbi:hypothetical protein [Candidatus Phytoplasma solani]|uniref:hypothetical protein n=1 Tax=Candidatus Phytoplasma solani TaxID=69896 RepID=UPI00358F94AD
MQKQTHFNKYFKSLLFFITTLVLFNFYNFKVYAFNPNDYEINYNTKHYEQTWKNEEGHAFSDNARVFYNIPGIKMMPCKSYQEFANRNQLTKDVFTIGLGFVPGIGQFVSGVDAFADYTGFYDHKINCTDSQIAILNDLVHYYLKDEPGKGVFLFDLNDLNKIKGVDISFCDCEMMSANVLGSFLDSLEKVFLKEDDDSDFENNNNLEQNSQIIIEKKIKREIKRQLIKKINKKIGHAIARKTWKKAAKKTIGKTLGRFFVPGLFNVLDKIEAKTEAESDIKKRCTFNITNNEFEKTIGFAIHFITEDNISIYEIRQDKNQEKKSYLINTFNLQDCTHMLVNLIQVKQNGEPRNVNVYCGVKTNKHK